MAQASIVRRLYFPFTVAANEYSINISGVTPGNLGVLHAVTTRRPPTFTRFASLSGWTQQANDDHSDGRGLRGLWYKRLESGDRRLKLVIQNPAVSRVAMAVFFEIGDWAGTVSDGIVIANTNYSQSYLRDRQAPPGLTASWTLDDAADQNLWVCGVSCIDDNSTLASYPTGYVDNGSFQSTAGGTDRTVGIATSYRHSNQASETPGEFRFSEIESLGAFSVGVRPAQPGKASGAGRTRFVGSGRLIKQGQIGGTGSFRLAGSGRLRMLAVLAGQGRLSSAPSGTLHSGASLAGRGTTALTGAGTVHAGGRLSGRGSLSLTSSATLQARGSLAGRSTMSLAPSIRLQSRSGLSGQGTLSLTLSATLQSRRRLSGRGAMTFASSGWLRARAGLSGQAVLRLVPPSLLRDRPTQVSRHTPIVIRRSVLPRYRRHRVGRRGLWMSNMMHQSIRKTVSEVYRIEIDFEPALEYVWQPNKSYTAGDHVRPSIGNGSHYRASQAGRSGTMQPNWPVAGGTVADGRGSLVWTHAPAGRESRDSIASAIVKAPPKISISDQSLSGTDVIFMISGGVEAQSHEISIEVTTDRSEVIEHRLRVTVYGE